MRIAYLINQYPKVSHSFIRREIQALERLGVEVQRIALRGRGEVAVSSEDAAEQRQTRYVLDGMAGGLALAAALVLMALHRPGRLAAALWLAFRMSRKAERGLAYHLAYLAEASRILPWLADSGASHVHAHFGTNAAEVAMYVAALGGPGFSFTVHGPEEFDKPAFIGLPEKMRRASFVVAISSFGRSQLYRCVAEEHWPKIHVVHCGLEPAFHGIPPVSLPAVPRLVCVGRLCEQKGQLLLVEAARRLAASGVAFELVLAGDGEMRPPIEAAIARGRLGERVRITGWISSEQVRQEILAARGLVLPSFAEGLPVVLMEAMALRRPVISTSIAGIPELVKPGENGWLIPAGSVEALAEAMAELLDSADETLARMGEAGRERVLARHAVDSEAARLCQLFESYRKAPGVGQRLIGEWS